MNLNDFEKLLQEELSNEMPNLTVEVDNSHSMVVKTDGSKTSSFSTEPLYERFLSGHPMQDIVDSTVEVISTIQKLRPENKHELINALSVRMVNAEKNADMLMFCPHDNIEDLAVVPIIKFEETSTVVNNALALDVFGLEGREVMEIAKSHTYDKFTFRSIEEQIADIFKEEGAPDEVVEDILTAPKNGLYVLSNMDKFDGAVMISSAKIRAEIHDKIGDFYVLPSSRHEVLCISKEKFADADALKNMVESVNAEVVDEKDFLSDNIYFVGENLRLIDVSSLSEEKVESKTKGRGR